VGPWRIFGTPKGKYGHKTNSFSGYFKKYPNKANSVYPLFPLKEKGAENYHTKDAPLSILLGHCSIRNINTGSTKPTQTAAKTAIIIIRCSNFTKGKFTVKSRLRILDQ